MAKPPEAPPSSDIEGVNRDARVGTPSKDPQESGKVLREAKDESIGRPKEGGD
ncbi:hypothetical protein [Sphingomonas sp. ID0503]|uniref:hypothetical protein n=1 Tax=Sphingomonas sp. ID0503 TaxID=3399691 RepID=UPI003AFAF842